MIWRDEHGAPTAAADAVYVLAFVVIGVLGLVGAYVLGWAQ